MNALTTAEGGRLEELEAVIRAGINTFWRVGDALAEINKDRLYRSSHPTFEAYCEDVWGVSRAHAYRLIEAAGVVKCLPLGDATPTERQARELVPLSPEAQREVWEMAQQAGDVTAARVARAREEYLSAQALAALPPEEQLRAVAEQERRALEYEENASPQDGAAVVKKVLKRTEALERLAAGLAVAPAALDHLHEFKRAVAALA